MKKIHYISFPYYAQGFYIGSSACGVVVPIEECKFATQDKKKVTCENCKRTKIM